MKSRNSVSHPLSVAPVHATQLFGTPPLPDVTAQSAAHHRVRSSTRQGHRAPVSHLKGPLEFVNLLRKQGED